MLPIDPQQSQCQYERHWLARKFLAANCAVSATRLARVSGFFAEVIHSKMPRFTDRGNASKFCFASKYALRVVLQKLEQQVVGWKTVSVRARPHAQIEPIHVASLSTLDHPAMCSLVFDLPVVVPLNSRDGF